MSAPDYVEPVVGWRLWHVVERRGELRLVSPLYRTTWVPREELAAACRRGAEPEPLPCRPGRVRHEPPNPRCRCGIHASRVAAQAVPYLSSLFKEHEDVLHRVLGRVALWGTVVECERGWRASHAYPAHLYVPSPRRPALFVLTGLRRPALPAEEIALELAAYGVPVEIVECATVRGLAETLDAPGSGLLEAA